MQELDKLYCLNVMHVYQMQIKLKLNESRRLILLVQNTEQSCNKSNKSNVYLFSIQKIMPSDVLQQV